jgi:hypothetical protein
MDADLPGILVLIFVALSFDFISGFHDAANSIATVVSTRVLTPGQAVFWAAFFNFVAAFTFGTAVATTIGSGLVDLSVVTFVVIFAGLIGAIAWVPRTAHELLSRAHRRLRWRCRCQGGLHRDPSRGVDEDADLHRAFPDHRFGAWIPPDGRDPVAVPPDPAGPYRSLVSAIAAVFGGRVQPRSGTAPTTRRRRWGSSQEHSWRETTCIWSTGDCQSSCGSSSSRMPRSRWAP